MPNKPPEYSPESSPPSAATRRSMPVRRVHKRLPHWAKVLLNRWMKKYGDPGDRTDPHGR